MRSVVETNTNYIQWKINLEWYTNMRYGTRIQSDQTCIFLSAPALVSTRFISFQNIQCMNASGTEYTHSQFSS